MSLTTSTEAAVNVFRKVTELATKHAPVEASLVGIDATDEHLIFNIEIGFGPADEISIPSESAQIAYQFTADFSEALAIYYPSFTQPPDETHREFAESFKARYSHATALEVAL